MREFTPSNLPTYGGRALWVSVNDRVDEKRLEGLPTVKVVVSPTTGTEHIDFEACKARDVDVLSLQGETEFLKTIPATAEHTIALILALVRRIPWAFDDVKAGNWQRDNFKGRDCFGKVLGIVGYGRIGQQVARMAWGLGFSVDGGALDRLEYVDILSIHLPLDRTTYGMIGAGVFGGMKNGSYLVNTSRGAIVDEKALLDALGSGHLAGAALDVLDGEPAIKDNPLVEYARTHDNLLITPHLGGATHESQERVYEFMENKLRMWAAKEGLPSVV